MQTQDRPPVAPPVLALDSAVRAPDSGYLRMAVEPDWLLRLHSLRLCEVLQVVEVSSKVGQRAGVGGCRCWSSHVYFVPRY